MVVGDILHSNVNNRRIQILGRLEGVACTRVLASFILNHDVEFDWVGMEVEGLIIN